MKTSMRTSIKKLVSCASFVSLGMVLGYLEGMIPIAIGIPGAKIGLANLTGIVCLYLFGYKEAFVVTLLRILLIAGTYGNANVLIYSLAGGIVSMSCMTLAKRMDVFGICGVSIIGGVTHNIAQITVAAIMYGTLWIYTYLSVLFVAGTIAGICIGVLAGEIIKRIRLLFIA